MLVDKKFALMNTKIDFTSLMSHGCSEYTIPHEVLVTHIPDLPPNIELDIVAEQCEAVPFNPVTVVFTQIGYANRWSYADCDDGEAGNCEFDIRCPDKFDYAAWLRAVFDYSTEQIDDLINEALLDQGSNALPAVEVQLLKTLYFDWLDSWRKRGKPLYVSYGVVDMYNKHGVRELVHRGYPLNSPTPKSK